MNNVQATLEKLKKSRPDLDIRDVEAERFSAMIFKDRDYPDGDDVLSMILPCEAAFHVNAGGRRRFCPQRKHTADTRSGYTLMQEYKKDE